MDRAEVGKGQARTRGPGIVILASFDYYQRATLNPAYPSTIINYSRLRLIAIA